MIVRKAEAVWAGNIKEGKGAISTESGSISQVPYSFAKRFGDEKGTNPEELIGAAHSACFSMALSGILAANGHVAKSIKTTDKVHIEKDGDGFSITKIEMECEGDVPGMDDATFKQLAEEAKKGCPVSKALTGVKIELHTKISKDLSVHV